MRSKVLAVCGLILLITSPTAASVQIPGLYNTGVDSSSALLADMAVDPHYSITSAPSAVLPTVPADAYTYGNLSPLYSVYPGSWVGNTAASQWIGPAANIVEPFDPDWAGDYSYELTFDLTGLDSGTAQISGSWATDNGSEIFLNGTSTGIVKSGTGYQSLDAFSITSGFVPGTNTLTFVVNNQNDGLDPNPSGIQVNGLQGTAEMVPEMASLAVWGVLSLTVTGGWWVRRRCLSID